MKDTAGSRLIIFIIGVITILAVKSISLQLIFTIFLLFINLYQGLAGRLKKLLLISLPFIITAGLLVYFQDGKNLILVVRLITIILWNVFILRDFNEQQLKEGLVQLHMPNLIVLIIFFILSYFKLIREEIQKLIRARKLRGARVGAKFFSIQEYLILGQVISISLSRSLERSDRIYKAMQLRGLKAETFVKNRKKLTVSWQPISLAVLFSVLIILLDRGW